MGSFIEDLWSSVFTPGPTPTLLVATNVTFAALQILLFALLLATYSIHFIVLSFLSGGLWWSINWFAKEVRAMQAQEARSDKKDTQKKKKDGKPRTPGAIDTESDTETERMKEGTPVVSGSAARAGTSTTTTGASTLQLPGEDGNTRKRPSVSGESSEHGSTDSEWEKVDETS